MSSSKTSAFVLVVVVLLALVYALSGCAGLDRYERTYSATWDADAQTGGLAITLRPVAGTQGGAGVSSPAVLSDATIERIVRLVEADRKRDVISLTKEIPEMRGAKK